MRAIARCGCLSVVFLFPLAAEAACPDQQAVAAYVADFKAARVSKGFGPDLSPSDAECAQAKLVQELRQVLGPVVGYKAGFTNPALQQRFKVAAPAWGVMLGSMLASGARLPAQFGARPQYEADFVAVVKDAGLADARTPLEALRAHLRGRALPRATGSDARGNPLGHRAHRHQHRLSAGRPGPAAQGRANPGVPGRAGQHDGGDDGGPEWQGARSRQGERAHGAIPSTPPCGLPRRSRRTGSRSSPAIS